VFSPTTPTVSQSIFFNGTLSTPDQGHRIVRYDWDFGTGSRRSGATVTRDYDVTGTFNVVLTVTDEVGQTGRTSQTLTVTASAAGRPTAIVNFSPTQPVVNQTVFFNGTASTPGAASSITSYSWDFGDGTTGTGATPSHAFAIAGTYVVRLTITNSDGQTGTTTVNVVVGGTPGSTASFSISPINPRVGTIVNFDGSGSTAPAGSTITNYAWDFGDGTTGNGVNVQHTYTAAFTYTIRLTVTDSAGRTATTTQVLTVVP
jgi:PKD repeat protein